MLIEQAYFSPHVKHFERGFLSRWELQTYCDKNAPCFFAGVYDMDDVDKINDHKGFAVVWNTGRLMDVFFNLRKDVIVAGTDIEKDVGGYREKKLRLEIKDFSMFKPNPLGEHVYWYMLSTADQERYGYPLYMEIKDQIDYNIILGYAKHPIEYFKENYYDRCFVNIKPCINMGITTATELAKMGRYTIGDGKFPFMLGIDDIVNKINIEAKKIGTITRDLTDDYFTTTKEWLNVNFWDDAKI